MDERKLAMLGLGFLFIVLGMAGQDDLEAYEHQARNYCEMVALYQRTDGESGWPDYRGNASEVCK